MTVVSDILQASTVDRPTLSRRACPVCASRSATPLHRCRYALFDDSDLPTETTIVACAGCGMVHADSAAAADDYRRHYRRHSKYETAVAASGSGVSEADALRIDETAGWIAPHLAAGASILDVGAGQGGLLRAFVSRGWNDVAGIDPSAGCVARMAQAGIVAAVGELEDPAWPTDPKRFDLVVLSHVLEHVFDATDVLARVARRTAEGGRIYIEVPDASRYEVGSFPPFYFLDPEHINHFDESTLRGLAGRLGWRVEASWTRTLGLASGERYPATGVLLRRGRGDGPSESDWPSTASSVARYLAACRTHQARGDQRMVGILRERGRPVVLWGAGSHAQRLLAQTPLGELPIDCIIDSDPGKQGRRLVGHRVVSASEGLARAAAIDADVAIAIAVGSADVVARLRADHPGLTVHVF